eukprot:9056317-Prorocentrum_lima.AAC.1
MYQGEGGIPGVREADGDWNQGLQLQEEGEALPPGVDGGKRDSPDPQHGDEGELLNPPHFLSLWGKL